LNRQNREFGKRRAASKTSHKDKENLWRRQESFEGKQQLFWVERGVKGAGRTKGPQKLGSRKIRLTIFHSRLQHSKNKEYVSAAKRNADYLVFL